MPVTPEQLQHLLDGFPWDEWSEGLKDAIEQPYRDVVITTGEAVGRLAEVAFNSRDPFVQRHMTTYIGERIVSLDEVTRREVSELIRTVLEERVEGTTFDLGTDIAQAVREKFSGYQRWRADRIARTETAIAYNHGTVLGAHQADFQNVLVLDGDFDEECAAANGQVWPLTKALAEPLAHPHCERSFVPTDDPVTI